MNLELLNPFAQDYPEFVENSLEANALCVRFNPSGLFAGQYLAAGRVDGCVSIIELETQNVVKFLEGHVRAVTCIGWSRNGRYLFSASRDWNVIVWDLSTGERRDVVRFDAPVIHATIHPRNSKILLMCLQGYSQAVLVDLRKDGKRHFLDLTQSDNNSNNNEESVDIKLPTATYCSFDPSGDYAYIGTSHGNILVYDCKSLRKIQTIAVGSGIRNFDFNGRGTSLLVNSNDRVLRLYHLEVLSEQDGNSLHFEPGFKFQDVVGRTPWNTCAFSKDGEYIVGGSGGKASHNIFLWDCSTGVLTKILEGPKDPLEDFDWHPIRPVIASVSSLGLIHVWVTSMTENWSAYAPGFEELEENLEYIEKEDEFDIEDETDMLRRKEDEQETHIDIISIDRLGGTTSNKPSWVQVDSDDMNEKFFPPLDPIEFEQIMLESEN